jgi:hypothetical protein
MNKGTVVALAVFTVLAGVAVVRSQKKAEGGIRRLTLKVDPKSVDKLQLGGEHPVTLVRKDSTWMIEGGRKADPGLVDAAVSELAAVSSSDLVTHDSKAFATYKVDDQSGIKVVATAGGREVASLVVGEDVAGGAYVRLGDEVFRAKGFSRSTFGRGENAWVNRKIFDFKPTEVDQLEVKVGSDKPYVLVKKGDAYELADKTMLPAGVRYDGSVASSMVANLANLRVKDFVETDPGVEKTLLGDQATVLTATLAGGAKVEVRLGGVAEEGTYYGKTGSDIFLMFEHSVRSLKKQVIDLRDLSLAKFNTDDVVELHVKGSFGHYTVKKAADQGFEVVSAVPKAPSDFKLDSSAVAARIGAIGRAKALHVAKDITASAAQIGATSPRVEVVMQDGSSSILAFGKTFVNDNEKREMVYVKGALDSDIYVIGKFTMESLVTPLASLDQSAAPSAAGGGMPQLDPKTLEQLPPQLREQLMRQMAQQAQR